MHDRRVFLNVKRTPPPTASNTQLRHYERAARALHRTRTLLHVVHTRQHGRLRLRQREWKEPTKLHSLETLAEKAQIPTPTSVYKKANAELTHVDAPVNNRRALVQVLLLRDPHLLER